jgi:hypothetical protein
MREERARLAGMARKGLLASLGEGWEEETRVASPRRPGDRWGLHAMGVAERRTTVAPLGARRAGVEDEACCSW